MSINKATQLAAVLIVRDEARSISRCLQSVGPWVDRLLVLDTGSTDTTVELARAAGAHVHKTAWLGSFALARNQALDLANADWNLILDADEWIESGGEQIRLWCVGSPRLGKVCVHSSYDRVGASAANEIMPTELSWITRLLPRGVRYEGRVHEQPVSPLPRERVPLYLNHDGYRDAQLNKKQGRNRELLLLELTERPSDPYILYQLGKDEEGRSEFAAACVHYQNALKTTGRNANWRHGLLLHYLHCLSRAGRSGEALKLAGAEMEAFPDSPDFYFVVGNLALDQAISDPEHAISDWLPLAAVSWERCLAIGERPDLEGSVHGRGSHLAQHNLDVLRSQTGLALVRK